MARTAKQNLKFSSYLWAVLGCMAKKRTDRSLIDVGSKKVDLTIVGKIGSARIDEHVAGTLQLGGQQMKAKSTAAPSAEVLAFVLSQLPDSKRFSVMQKLKNTWASKKSVPKVSDDEVKAAKQLLSELRASTKQTVAGNLTFAIEGE